MIQAYDVALTMPSFSDIDLLSYALKHDDTWV